MNNYFKRDVAERMFRYVRTYYKSFKGNKCKKGVFADINEDFTHCDNTGMKQTDCSNSGVTKNYKRYYFNGFDWTVEKLEAELDLRYKKYLLNQKLKDIQEDFV